MKLFFEIILLCLLLLIFTLLYSLYLAPSENFINQTLRPLLISSNFTRRLLHLNQVGDWRYVYTNSLDPLTVQVWYDPQFSPRPEFSTWIEAMVRETVDREVIYTQNNADLNIIIKKESTDAPTNAGLVLSPHTIYLYQVTINNLNQRDDIRMKLEQSTLMHEWGHLLGLEHINQEGCIMSEKVEVYDNRLFQGTNLPTRYCAEELYQLKKSIQNGL